MPSETPFLPEQVSWSWKVVDERADGSCLVRVDLVENRRMQEFLSDNEVAPGLDAVVVEDDFLTLWQTTRNPVSESISLDGEGRPKETTRDSDGSKEHEIHLYRQQDRFLSVLTRRGTCIVSNVLNVDGTDHPRTFVGQLIGGLRASAVTAPSIQSDVETRIRSQQGLGLSDAPSVSSELPDLYNPLVAQEGGSVALRAIPLKTGGWILPTKTMKNRRLASQLRLESKKDLLPESWRARAVGHKVVSGLLLFSTLCIAVALALSFLAGKLEQRTRDARLSIDGTRELLKEDLEEVQAAQLMIERVATWSGTARMVLGAWDRVSASVPSGVALSSLTIRGDGDLAIHGTAPDRGRVVTLMDALRTDRSGLFRNVVLGGLEERNGQQAFHVLAHVVEGTEVPQP
jgi:hypothetical protein